MRVKIAKLLTIALVISCQANASRRNNCKCTAALGETTHQGGNEILTFRERRTYKLVRGVVHDVNNEPLADVLVEVFDHPEWIALNYPASRVKQHRIAACKTGSDGNFCFENLAAGRYELRASKEISWNPSHVYIVVNPRGRKSTRARINLQLRVGT